MSISASGSEASCLKKRNTKHLASSHAAENVYHAAVEQHLEEALEH